MGIYLADGVNLLVFPPLLLSLSGFGVFFDCFKQQDACTLLVLNMATYGNYVILRTDSVL